MERPRWQELLQGLLVGNVPPPSPCSSGACGGSGLGMGMGSGMGPRHRGSSGSAATSSHGGGSNAESSGSAATHVDCRAPATCIICMHALPPINAQPVSDYTLACGHRFHSSCAAAWLAQHGSCPACGRAVSPPIRSLLMRRCPGAHAGAPQAPLPQASSSLQQHLRPQPPAPLHPPQPQLQQPMFSAQWILSAVMIAAMFAGSLAIMDALRMLP